MTQTLVESPAIVNPEIEDGDDWLTILFKAEYEEMLGLAVSSHIQNKIKNLPIPWQMTYAAYVRVWQAQFGHDFSAFPLPGEPAVDLPDDFDQWVLAMEGDYADAYSQQFTGVPMF